MNRDFVVIEWQRQCECPRNPKIGDGPTVFCGVCLTPYKPNPVLHNVLVRSK